MLTRFCKGSLFAVTGITKPVSAVSFDNHSQGTSLILTQVCKGPSFAIPGITQPVELPRKPARKLDGNVKPRPGLGYVGRLDMGNMREADLSKPVHFVKEGYGEWYLLVMGTQLHCCCMVSACVHCAKLALGAGSACLSFNCHLITVPCLELQQQQQQ